MYMHEEMINHGGPGTTSLPPLLGVGVLRKHLDRASGG